MTSVASITVNGGTLTSAGTSQFASGAAITLTGNSTLTLGGNATFSTGSTFNWSGGTWNNAAGTTLAFDGGVGSFAVAGGGAPAGRSLSDGSTLRITNGGKLTTNGYFEIADSEFFSVSTGTMIVQDPGSNFTSTASGAGNATRWGYSGFDSATITFANFGVGSYNTGLEIGNSAGAATVNIQSSAQLNTASLLAGVGSMNISHGVNITVNGGALNVTGAANFNKGVTLNLQTGGSVNFGGGATFTTGSTFNWTSGTWNNPAGTTLAFDGGAGNFPAIGRGLSDNSTLRITNGGVRGAFQNEWPGLGRRRF